MYRFIPLLLLFVLSWSCQKEEALSPDGDLIQKRRAEAKERIAQAEAELAEAEVDWRGAPVIVPANSVNALADAIQQAGPNGTVILEAGDHLESQTVLIPYRLRLLGQSGAVLRVTTAAPDLVNSPYPVIPAIHVRDADRTRIQNLEILPDVGQGRAGILVENSRSVRVIDNTLRDFQLGMVFFGTDRAKITGNTLVGIALVEITNYGITCADGKNVLLKDNHISHHGTGIFVSDEKGILLNNLCTSNTSDGITLCNLPDFFLTLPDGGVIAAPGTCVDWVAANNTTNDNQAAGFQIIDGAAENILLGNESSNNAFTDYVLFGELDLGTIVFPTTRDNLLISVQQPDAAIIDCGEDNLIVGGNQLGCPF